MDEDLFKGLNKQQKKAVTYCEGPSIILAGAGSGKTRVLIHKVLYLIEELKVPSEEILMITFTNKAAGEMKRRISKYKKGNLGFVGTFHSLCALILRLRGTAVGIPKDFVIYDDEDQAVLMKQIVKDKDIKKFMP